MARTVVTVLDGKDGTDGRDGRDGVGAASAMIDRGGNLILTMTDGSTKELGSVVGKDGADGRDGNDGSPGAPGQNGADGIGFDDMDLIETDEGMKFRFARGDVVKDSWCRCRLTTVSGKRSCIGRGRASHGAGRSGSPSVTPNRSRTRLIAAGALR